MKLKHAIILIILIVLLFPTKRYLKDGGSIMYKSMIYEVTKVHSLKTDINDTENLYETGIRIEVFGREVYENVK